MQPRFSHTILPYTIALLCSIGFIAILRNRGIINTLDSHILFCLLACIYLLALVYTLWYKSKSYHIYPLHISCLLTLLDYCAISTIDTKAIKSSISIIFFDGSIILYAHNFYRFSGKTKMQIGIDTSRFYVELDWDRFYMQFPIMQELKSEFMNLKERFGRESDFQKQFKDFINDTLPDVENIEDSQEYTMALNPQAMRENKRKNKEVFKLYKKEETLAESHRAIQDLQKPSEIIDNNLYFQRFDINTNVFLQYLGLSKLDAFPLSKSPIQHKNEILHKFHSNPKYKQNFALYSISGAFNIFYIPSHIQISRVTKTYGYHFSFLYAACKKVRAFIIDTVNFNNDDDSDQPIGVWDYENVGFDLFYSIIQYRQSRIFGGNSSSPVPFSFFLYNSHFKKSQTHFNLGLDFFLYSSTFLDITSEE